MRKQRSKYKVCGRLGYNAMLRLWLGKKKKWQKRGRFYDERSNQSNAQEAMKEEPKKVVNPRVLSTNEERRGERNPYANGSFGERSRDARGKEPLKSGKVGGMTMQSKQKSMMRRKDVHGRVQSQATGRKTRYGGLTRDHLRKDIGEQREIYKSVKSANERRYRKGMRISDAERAQMDSQDKGNQAIKMGRMKQPKQSHRLARTEVRVDRRRWRSGRVPTLQRGRDLVEHGHVSYVNEDGSSGHVVNWQGARVEAGQGRKIHEFMWKRVKGMSNGLLEHEEYAMTASSYMEVDYVTGVRVLLRKPNANEVVVPKGMDLSGWTSWKNQ